MLVKTFDQTGKELSQTRLPAEIFGVKINHDLIQQVVFVQTANRRQPLAHTKGRGEVSGGGKKPWRQKGTGRARHGSIRSPLWKGGGATFGPTKEKVFNRKINKKMRRQALFMVLTAKANDGLLVVLDDIKLEKPKTKIMSEILMNLPCKDESSLLAVPNMDKNMILASRNLAEVKTMQAKDLNVLDLLQFKYLVMPKESIKVIKETFAK